MCMLILLPYEGVGSGSIPNNPSIDTIMRIVCITGIVCRSEHTPQTPSADVALQFDVELYFSGAHDAPA